MKKRILAVIVLLLGVTASKAQLREFAIHSRGMLHETVFNTGEIGRGYDQGGGGSVPGMPAMEWPARSATIVDGVKYNGQYNIFGGGMYLAGTAPDSANRMYAFCGGAGAGSPEPAVGRFSFPLELTRTENFPVLASGALNPAYNPDEAEELIRSRWATPLGLTVTRVSRAWSFPDYDDFIIYEYEIELTGDRDGVPTTIESDQPLNDVMVAFAYGFTPSMFGSERKNNRWSYVDYESNDLRARFDRRRWLNYTIDRDGKPEPKYFEAWARDNVNGGGLLSPQAVGFMPLYYDTTRLAHPGETGIQITAGDVPLVWDANQHIKQPYLNRLETSNLRIDKIQPYLDNAQTRKNNPYRNLANYGMDWVGRGSFNWRQSQKFGVGRILVFGPYTMRRGDRIRFAIAELAGYGAARQAQTAAYLQDEGGSCGELCGESSSIDSLAWNPVPNWTSTIKYGGAGDSLYQYGSTYLTKYPLPQYVNSTSVTLREVADRVIEAYGGKPYTSYDSLQYWPEAAAERGAYRIPIPFPAPVLQVASTNLAQNRISWTSQVESFSSPRLTGQFSHYELYKASSPLGPWSRLDSIGKGDPRYFLQGEYAYIDSATRVLENHYYSLISVDRLGFRSGRTNIILHQTQLGAAPVLGKVYVVPNPFVVRSNFKGSQQSADIQQQIGFYNLPEQCTIRIFSYSGQLVETLEHNSNTIAMEYFQVTRNNQVMASGVYFYVVETPDGKTTHGKFVVIH